jgi:TIR domain
VADIFISYIPDDRQWAFWIGRELEKMGHVPRVHEWELASDDDTAQWMEQRHGEADHVLCVISEAYRDSPHAGWEQRAMRKAAETGRANLALRVLVEPQHSAAQPIVAGSCELHGLSEDQARSILREFVSFVAESGKPERVETTGNVDRAGTGADVPFPGSSRTTPPIPRLALSIGVVGHRPDRLVHGDLRHITSEVERVIDSIIHEVDVVHGRYKEFFRGATPQLCVVSALAEGADRIVAEAAMAKNFILDAPIPFLEDEYLKDFVHEPAGQSQAPLHGMSVPASNASVAEFKALINDRATRALLQLPGSRGRSGRATEREADKAYEMAGLTVIGQSDILLTVWDGGISHGRGGTTDMLHQAVRRGVPIIAIDVSGAETRVYWSNLRESPVVEKEPDKLPSGSLEEVLPRLIEEFLRPPEALSERDALLSYLGCPASKSIWSRAAARLADWFGTGRKRAVRATALARHYREILERVTKDNTRPPNSTLLAETFGWADVMAIHYAKIFRFAYIFNFAASALAVTAALVSLLVTESNPYHRWPPVFEITLIVLVILNTMLGRRFGWHMRWMEAREVAERMRVAILFWILGAQPPAFFGEEPAWTGWYARAIIREQGMRGGRLDRDGMSAARAEMLRVLEDQHDYHHRNSHKMRRREVGLERIGQAFFLATLLLAITHVWGEGLTEWLFYDYPGHKTVHIILTAILPTVATAMYGMRVIGDFEGRAKRSKRTELGHWRVIEALRRDPADLILFRARAQIVSDAMLGDVSSWRLSAESRGLAVPG